MTETGALLLCVLVLHALSEWRWKRTLERLENQEHRRWQRLASLLTGTEDTVELEALDRESKRVIERGREMGMAEDGLHQGNE